MERGEGAAACARRMLDWVCKEAEVVGMVVRTLLAQKRADRGSIVARTGEKLN